MAARPEKNSPLLQRVRYALAGLAYGLRAERSLRAQAAVFVALLGVLAWTRPPAIWWAVLILMGVAVIAAELINSALEALADHLAPGPHPRVQAVKDCAAAAVLVLVAGALAVALAFLTFLIGR
jgi:diacylglycerol kinase (ATP)